MKGLRAAVLCLFGTALPDGGNAHDETPPICHSVDAQLATACSTRNPAPHPIPAVLGGAPLGSAACARAMTEALASAHAYDDPYCQPVDVINRNMPVGKLKYVGDAVGYLLFFRQQPAIDAGFRGSLFCDEASKEILLAFPGTEINPLHQRFYPDMETNVLNHTVQRPGQYEFALEAADRVKEKWSNGYFDGSCGSGHPALVLTGHSKGGAEAQFSAVGLELGAIVFNSDWVALASYDDMPLPDNSTGQQGQPIRCFPSVNAGLRAYYESGAIRDIRMVNYCAFEDGVASRHFNLLR
jgi:hypothetical protein